MYGPIEHPQQVGLREKPIVHVVTGHIASDHEQRDAGLRAVAVAVALRLADRQHLAVVSGDDQQAIVEEAPLLQFPVEPPEFFLHVLPDVRLARFPSAGIDVRGVIVTSGAISAGSDFVSRFFAPRVGVDEDPVTGSAHCALAPFWEERLGRTNLVGYQVSARGGRVRTRVQGERVLLSGQAVTVLRAELV